jgi:hypothetical protein
MPMILRTMHDRLEFRFGHQTGLRSTCDTVEQLQMQIEQLKAQLKFNSAEYEKQIAVLIRDVMEARYELARRDMIDAFAGAPSPSAMKH